MAHGGVLAAFEQPLNDYTSAAVSRVLHDFYEIDPKLGFYGGGGLDARFGAAPISFALGAVPPERSALGQGIQGLASRNLLALDVRDVPLYLVARRRQ